MRTYSDEIVQMARRSYSTAVSLAGRDHTPAHFKSLLTDLGAAVEVFLKEHIYVGGSSPWTFKRLIDGLAPMRVPDQDRAYLHALRVAYNKAKHDPTYDAPMQPVITVLIESEQALSNLAKLGLGDSSRPSTVVQRRLLWLAAWDHYIGGDTELSVFLPCTPDVDIPAGFETIYLRMEDWDEIKAQLSNAGRLCVGRGCVPDKFFDFWSQQGDFLDAASFEGDLRDMIAVLAAHERVEDILPELKRESEPYSMLAAALFAITDLAAQAQLPDDQAVLRESIIKAAEMQYAAPRSSVLLQECATAVAALVCKCPIDVRAQIKGPLWVGGIRYAELEFEKLFQSDDLAVMILRDGTLIAKI